MRVHLSPARRLCAVALVFVLFAHTGTSAIAADAGSDRAAYDFALKCFVADGYASDERKKVGDDRKSEAYRTKARASFDLAYAAGPKLGLSDATVSRDLDFAQKTELPRFIRDPRYLLDTASTCKALGLM